MLGPLPLIKLSAPCVSCVRCSRRLASFCCTPENQQKTSKFLIIDKIKIHQRCTHGRRKSLNCTGTPCCFAPMTHTSKHAKPELPWTTGCQQFKYLEAGTQWVLSTRKDLVIGASSCAPIRTRRLLETAGSAPSGCFQKKILFARSDWCKFLCTNQNAYTA